MSRNIERLATWLALGVVAVFALLLTLSLGWALEEGQIREFSKSAGARHIALSSEPAAFLSAFLLHGTMAAVAWVVLVVAWRRTSSQR